jgi:cyclase
MNSGRPVGLTTRRQMLRTATALGGGAVLARLFPETLVHALSAHLDQPPGAAAVDQLAAFRAQMGAAPIQTQKITDALTLLSGPGGNVVVLDGPDGKLVVDTFVLPAWPKFKESLDSLGKAPLKFVVDTHWHFDHTDNNAALRAAGATVLAHENTKTRMSEPHELAVLGVNTPASPALALPQQTFRDRRTLQANGETLALVHVPPSHTDTDIYVHFEKANVLHLGDLFFNGFYPYIDGGTRGSIDGMIAAGTRILALADSETKIVPGHGPLGNKTDLAKFRDMLVTARDRVRALKSSGKTVQEAVDARPFADLDAVWGKGLFTSDVFVRIVYVTL